VPLDAQDVRLWRQEMIAEAVALMASLAPFAVDAGRSQLEAAIQHAHLARWFSLPVAWETIAGLYGRLASLTGSPVAALNALAARARIEAPGELIDALRTLVREAPMLQSYQPRWALEADLCAKAGRIAAARAAYDEAIARERDGAIIAFLNAKRAAL
ncbi:MAG: RNA polymerase subunit sigma-70, partial [Hyphomonadaceae bacterium]